MHENSMNHVAFFHDAAFVPASGLSKIDASPQCPDDACSDDARCFHNTQGDFPKGASGTRSRESQVEQSCARAGMARPCRHDGVRLTRPGSPGELPMASGQGTRTFMPVHRTVHAGVVRGKQGKTGNVASAHFARPKRPLVSSAHTASAMHSSRRSARRRRMQACEQAGAAATYGGGQLPRMGSGISKGDVSVEMDKTWEYPMPLIESQYVHARWFEGFLCHALLLHAPPAPRQV